MMRLTADATSPHDAIRFDTDDSRYPDSVFHTALGKTLLLDGVLVCGLDCSIRKVCQPLICMCKVAWAGGLAGMARNRSEDELRLHSDSEAGSLWRGCLLCSGGYPDCAKH